MNSGKRALWRRFIEIAQPYFFPNVRGGRWATLLLMSGLLVVLFALLTIVVAGVALAVGHFAPTVAEEIAPGMASLIDGCAGLGRVADRAGPPGRAGAGLRRLPAPAAGARRGLAAARRRAAPVAFRHRHQRRLQLHQQLFHQRPGEEKPGHGLPVRRRVLRGLSGRHPDRGLIQLCAELPRDAVARVDDRRSSSPSISRTATTTRSRPAGRSTTPTSASWRTFVRSRGPR